MLPNLVDQSVFLPLTEYDALGFTSTHVISVEAKHLRAPLDTVDSNSQSTLDQFHRQRDSARFFKIPVEFHVYSVSGYTPAMRQELERLGFKLFNPTGTP